MCRTDSEYLERMLEFIDEDKHDAEMEALHESITSDDLPETL